MKIDVIRETAPPIKEVVLTLSRLEAEMLYKVAELRTGFTDVMLNGMHRADVVELFRIIQKNMDNARYQ